MDKNKNPLPQMKYKRMGNTGLTISNIGFGTWLNHHSASPSSLSNLQNLMSAAYNMGINYFDNAEMYGCGESEIAMGKCLKALGWERKDYIVLTKIFKCIYPGDINGNYLSRKHIIEGAEASLERLGLEYADIILCHRYDKYTPIEEVCRAMNYLIENGECMYWGTSYWNSAQIAAAFGCCEKLSLIKPVVEQSMYNMLVREAVEKELEYALDMGIGLIGFGVLGSGLLTGKYNTGVCPQGSRFLLNNRPSDLWTKLIKDEGKREHTLTMLNKLGEISKELNVTQSELSIAWGLRNGDLSSAVIGANTEEQLMDDVRALDLVERWDAGIEQKIEGILGNRPIPNYDWRTWGLDLPRRLTKLNL